MILNQKITYSRKKAQLSQIDLADRLGVSRQSVSKWETGETNPSIEKLPEIAKALGVSVEWLLSDEDLEEVRDTYEAVCNADEKTEYPEWVNVMPRFVRNHIRKKGMAYFRGVTVAGAVMALSGLLGQLILKLRILRLMSPFGPAAPDLMELEHLMKMLPVWSTVFRVLFLLGLLLAAAGLSLARRRSE